MFNTVYEEIYKYIDRWVRRANSQPGLMVIGDSDTVIVNHYFNNYIEIWFESRRLLFIIERHYTGDDDDNKKFYKITSYLSSTLNNHSTYDIFEIKDTDNFLNWLISKLKTDKNTNCKFKHDSVPFIADSGFHLDNLTSYIRRTLFSYTKWDYTADLSIDQYFVSESKTLNLTLCSDNSEYGIRSHMEIIVKTVDPEHGIYKVSLNICPIYTFYVKLHAYSDIIRAIKGRITADITNEKEIIENLDNIKLPNYNEKISNDNYHLLDHYRDNVKSGILDTMSSSVKCFLRNLTIEDSKKKELIDSVKVSKTYNGYKLDFIIPMEDEDTPVNMKFNIGVNDDGYCLNGDITFGLNNSRIPFSLTNANEDNVVKLIYRLLALLP